MGTARPVRGPGAGGWFLLRGRVSRSTGASLRARCVTAAGADHEVDLGDWRADEALELVVPLPRGATDVVLVDADSGDPAVEGVEWYPLGRLRAAWRMLEGGAGGPPRPGRRRWSSLACLLLDTVTAGPRVALKQMAAAYRAELGHPRHEPFPCMLRLSSRRAPRKVGWRPIHHVRVDGGVLQAEGDDPQFALAWGGFPARLPAGWYVVDASLDIHAGRIIAPALYPDYGQGCLPAEMVPLPEPAADGSLHCLVMFKAPVHALRLDPSVRRASFSPRHFELRKVGRSEALLRLLDARGTGARDRDWGAIAAAAGAFLRDVFRHGVSGAASRLHQGEARPAGEDYDSWVRRYDTLHRRDFAGFRSRAAAFADGPLVSVLLPAYNTPDRFLRRCIRSVLAQAYPHWELCIVDDASTSAQVWRTASEFAARDQRIRIRRRTENGHIAAASNDALEMARGEYIALLDHDDELRPHALLEMMEAVRRDPEAAFLYSDEDKIDERGRRFQPNFKPDWNPDLLLSQNYVCHLSVMRTELARDAGGFRPGFEGSQDHDLFLRCSALLRPGQVVHVPKVLYHWRAIEGSTALERGAKDYAADAGLRAVADHLGRHAPGAAVEHLAHGHYRVRWPLQRNPLVDIIIPTRDRLELVRPCIESILALTGYDNYGISLVDNQSEDPATLAWMEEISRHPRVRVLRFDAPFNFSAINNLAAAQSGAEVLCLLNNDIEVVDADWLRELASQAMRPGIGAVGAMLFFPNRTIQHAGVILGMGGIANHVYAGAPEGHPGHCARALVAQDLSAVTAACLVVRKDRYVEVGGLDERLRVAFNDVDFCLRLQEAGYRNVWTPFARLLHHESATRGRDEDGPARERFLGEARTMDARWGELLYADPAWNPNLSLDSLDASLAFPPRAGTRMRRPSGRPR